MPILPTGDIGDLVQHLHADHTASGDQPFRPVRLCGIAGCDINNTLVSKKLPGIRLVPVELEVGGKAPPKGAKAL